MTEQYDAGGISATQSFGRVLKKCLELKRVYLHSVIYRDYEKYRNYFHEVRENVENGTRFTHALLGPKGKLSVVPNKDINISSVVIAGRSKNDLEESRQRHNIEITSSPPIRLESWDSLINKY
ncbi:TPA: DUF4263 domain-containing protein [Serratia odorifera]|nr:DUF4263 domain-containing protein [Serratia odorifera]